jgi:AsmA protein
MKKVLVISGVMAAMIAMAFIVGALLFDINSFKPRIEKAISEAAGLDVRIQSKVGLSLFPFGLSAHDIRASNQGIEILSIEKLKLRPEFIPLLKKQLRIIRCEVYKPNITIVEGAKKKHDSGTADKKLPEKTMATGFTLKELRLSHGILVHTDKNTGDKTEFKDINLAIADFRLPAGVSKDIPKYASFTGTLDCGSISRGDLKIHHVKSPVKAEKGILLLSPLAMDVFGGKGEGDASLDMSGDPPTYKMNLKVPELDFVKLEESFGAKKLIGGKGNLEASLWMEDKEDSSLMGRMGGMGGSFTLRGNHLILFSMDLDKALTAYEKTQEFNLVDLGAFFIAGPLGTFGMKGHSYLDVYSKTREGQGKITQLVSRWTIKNGMADAKDCALSTRHNRVALKGHLNLVRGRYDNVTVALIDDRGCAKFKQSITGTFQNPQIGKVSAVQTLGGPILNLYNKAKSLVQGDDCEVFYNGSVGQP